jgi:hypothetical protein
VSDAYGLRRYQTDDVFRCVGHVGGLPDLRFLRRRTLSYSFTGEKLTGEQVSLALEKLRAELELGTDVFLTCVPTAADDATPHYWLIHVDQSDGGATVPIGRAAERFDTLVADINPEYSAKRRSGRLGPMHGAIVDMNDFLWNMGASHGTGSAQFKFLPLYRRRWPTPRVGTRYSNLPVRSLDPPAESGQRAPVMLRMNGGPWREREREGERAG